MAGNNIYVQGSYIDVHDNEHVYLTVDKAEVRVKDEVSEDGGMAVDVATLAACVDSVREYFCGSGDCPSIPKNP